MSDHNVHQAPFFDNLSMSMYDQDQTGQTVQSVGFTLSVNLWDIFLSNI